MFLMCCIPKKLKEFLPTYLHLVGYFPAICRILSTRRKFPMFLALDFPQLLDAMRNRSKFYINIQQGLKKPPEWVFRFILLLSQHQIHFFVPQYKFIVLDAIIAFNPLRANPTKW